MNFEYSPYILPLAAATIVSFLVAIYAWTRRTTNGALALVIMSLSIAEWTIGYSLEIAGTNLETKYIWGVIQYFGIALAPYGFLMFSISYNDQIKTLSRRFILLTALIPSITILLALTTKWHGLIWSEYHINQQGNFSALGVSYGAWFWVHFAYSYIILLIGTILLVRTLFRKQGMYRGQIIAMLIAVLTPWISNILYFTGNSPIPYLDPTPFAFTITVAAVAWAIFGFHLVDITPLARDRVVDSMQDGMIVIDTRGNIVDINSAAARMIGVPASSAIGKPAGDVFQPWPHLIERFRDVIEANEEISVGTGNATHRYQVRFSPLVDQQEKPVGRIIMLRAMDEAFIPQPKPVTKDITHQASPKLDPQPMPASQGRFFNSLTDFFITPVQTNLEVPKDINPGWYQARERSFTIIIRISALIGTIAYFLTLPFIRATTLSPINIAYGAVIGLVWFLGLARKINFRYRAGIFLFILYLLGFVETLNFGYSVESFIFFMTMIITSILLTGRKGGWTAASASLVTLGTFGFLISKENFIPFNLTVNTITPRSFETGITSLFVFAASAMAISTSITILMESLNRAWQLETQALNLLQQERDLLEQRVDERTHQLAEARDEALTGNIQLRKYFRAIEQSGNTVIILDKNGLIEYVNPKFTEVTGYTPTEVLGKSPTLLYGPDNEHDLTLDEAWAIINAGQIWRGEFQNRRKDGSAFWESATIAPVHNHDSEIINFVEIKQDITEQKMLQDQLQNQNDYLSILHQITLDLLNRRELNDLLQVIVDRSAVLLDAPFSELMLEKNGVLVVESFTTNQASLKGDRVTREEAKLSWQAFDTHQPVILEDYAVWEYRREIYAAQSIHATAEFPVMAGDRCVGVLSLGRSQSNYTFTAEQVETGILFARLVALVLDNANLYNSAMQEIDQRRRTVILLVESEARFRQIVENASDIIYRTDIDGNFVYFNPTAVSILGYQNETEILGKSYLDMAAPEWRHKLKRFYARQLMTKENNTYFEFPTINPSGETVWLGQSVQIIKEGDEIIGFQAVARDITKLVQVREALALSRDQALDASRFKSQLLSRVSHELRTPLGGILGYAELLQEKAFGAINEKQDKAIKQIVESTHFLTNTVNDLLDESQIEAKSLSLNNKYFSPSDLLNKIKTSMTILAGKKNLAFHAEVSPDLPTELYGDIHRLQQVLVNLAGNAIKFTRAGEVRISIQRPAPAQWSMQVSDTGAGIHSNEFETIFEPFRQVNNSITRENRGSGLGLAITKQLIELMGGQITLDSEIGKGSTFTVLLPINNAPGE